jgi:hypothetical protein
LGRPIPRHDIKTAASSAPDHRRAHDTNPKIETLALMSICMSTLALGRTRAQFLTADKIILFRSRTPSYGFRCRRTTADPLYVGIPHHLVTFEMMRQTFGHGPAAARDAEGHLAIQSVCFGRAALPQQPCPKVCHFQLEMFNVMTATVHNCAC